MCRVLAGAVALWAVLAASESARGIDFPFYGNQPYREPRVLPPPPIRVDVTRPGRHVQIELPPEANAGILRSTYWLTGDEPLVIDVEIGIGPGGTRAGLSVSCSLFVDGRQKAFWVEEGGPRPVLTVRRELARHGDTARFRIRVPGHAMPARAHSGTLILWDERGASFPAINFVVFRDSTEFAPRRSAPARVVYDGGGQGTPVMVITDLNDHTRPIAPGYMTTAMGPDERGTLRLRVALEAPGATRGALVVPCAVVALLDGKQIALGGLGFAPHVDIPRGKRVELDIALEKLPTRGRHALMLFALFADGHYTELPLGQAAPWNHPPVALGALSWSGGSPGPGEISSSAGRPAR